MGMCDYCGTRAAGYEVVDDRQDSGMAMICEACNSAIAPKEDDIEQEARNYIKQTKDMLKKCDDGIRFIPTNEFTVVIRHLIEYLETALKVK